ARSVDRAGYWAYAIRPYVRPNHRSSTAGNDMVIVRPTWDHTLCFSLGILTFGAASTVRG
ncbi:MAG: hypothetical protein ACM3ZQ_05515, partial [Bacillota bacterium]